MKQLAPPDKTMLIAILLLMAYGLLMVASASLSVSEVRYGNPLRILGHWLIYIPIGLGLAWLLSNIDTRWWQASALPILGLGLLLMILVLIPGLGSKINGAQRWLSLFGLTLQPVELLKPVIVLYMAYYMSRFPERLHQFSSGLAPMLIVLATAVVLLLLQPDFGSAVLLCGVCFLLWFVGGIPLRHLGILLGTILPVGIVVLMAEAYRIKRFTSFIDPWADPFGSGYQLVQSILAFGAGGIKGAGLGQGVQKLFYLPEAFTDFIAAVIAEELGLGGILILMTLFGLLLWRALGVAFEQNEMFARLLVMGCVMLIGFAFMINMGAAMGILPTKGMPMPFVSYGGSALLGNCILAGLIFSVQRHMQARSPERLP